MSAERLQKVLAAAGIASRRDCEELIAAGRVTVNGKVMHTLGARVNPESDEILVDGAAIQKAQPRTYLLLNKPTGVISTAEDTHERPTVVEMVQSDARLFPVGRLDQDSEGLILLTDDGALTQRLTHPSYHVEKEYRALLDRTPDADTLRDWRDGVELDGEQTAPAWVDVQEKTDDGTWVRIVLQEGRKRQIREVARLLGYEVKRLIRVREGSLTLGDLPLGESRPLTEAEVDELWQHVGGRPNQEGEIEAVANRSPRNRPSVAARGTRSRGENVVGEERPRRERMDRDNSQDREERPRLRDTDRESRSRDERPQREGYRERSSYAGNDRPQRDYSSRNQRSERSGGYNRDDRPQREGYRSDRPQREGYRSDRPQREGYRSDRPGYTSRDQRSGGYNRDDRNQRSGGYNRDERPQREGYRDRPSYTSRDQRSERSGGYNRDDRPQRSGGYNRDERPQRSGGYSRDERPQREGYRDRPNYGNRNERPGYSNRDRPSRSTDSRASRGPASRSDRSSGVRSRPGQSSQDRPAAGRPRTRRENEDES